MSTYLYRYPTRRQLRVLSAWTVYGPGEALHPEPGHERCKAMTEVRGLIKALDADPALERLTRAVFRLPIDRLSPQLHIELYRAARFHGYLDHTGRPVPMSGRRLHMMRLAAQGRNTTQTAEMLDVSTEAVASVMQSARRQAGAATTAELIAIAYGLGWFPVYAEQRDLRALVPGAPMPAGFRRVSS